MKTEFWLALHAALGGTVAAGEFLRRQLYTQPGFASDAFLREAPLSPALKRRLRQAKDALPRAQKALKDCQKAGWTVLTPESACYPPAFRVLKDPPLALFAAGDPTLLQAEKIAAIVGTRDPAVPAMIGAYRLGQAFSEHGVVTVSGGAMGIDSAAHEGALSGPGVTIAVLGSGLGNNYLADKAFMRRRIEQRGLLVTELFPYDFPSRATFPRRNRLIAALGQTVTVAQSDRRGGSMISADYALKFGRKLFVFSGSVYFSPGCEKLISSGAVPITDAADVLACYGVRHVSVPLENDGIGLPRILAPEACTLEEFAALNGATPAEIRPAYEKLLARAREAQTASRQPQVKKQPEAALSPLAQAAQKARRADENALSGDERAVFLALEETPMGLDDLADLTSLSPSQVMTAVTMLELKDLAVTLPGDRVVIKN